MQKVDLVFSGFGLRNVGMWRQTNATETSVPPTEAEKDGMRILAFFCHAEIGAIGGGGRLCVRPLFILPSEIHFCFCFLEALYGS